MHDDLADDENDDFDEDDGPVSGTNGNNSTTYFTVVIKQLTTILRDGSLSNLHEIAAATSIKIVSIVGNEALPHLRLIIDAFVYRIDNVEFGNNLKEALMDNLISFVEIIGPTMRRFSDIFLKLIQDYHAQHLQRCLELLDAMYMAFPLSDFDYVMKSTLPLLINTIKKESINGEHFAHDEGPLYTIE